MMRYIFLLLLFFSIACGGTDKKGEPGEDSNNGGTNNGSNNEGTNNGSTSNGSNNEGTNNGSTNNGSNNGSTNNGSRCFEAAVSQVDFGPVDGSASIPVTFENCGDVDVSVTLARAEGTGFSVSAIEPALPVVLASDESVVVTVTYETSDDADATGTLVVETDEVPVEIPLTAERASVTCPTVTAGVAAQGSSTFTSTLQTTSLSSVSFQVSGPGVSTAPVEWSLIQRPRGSTSTFLPDTTSPSPSMFLDVVGDYVVEVRVPQAVGDDCQLRVSVTAAPTAELYLEIVWESPTDADQTDAVGTDVDIHLLHPNGTWDTAPYDTFWENPAPSWAISGAGGDPRLEIDDADGAGPEVITMELPENLIYRWGAFYYEDGGFGPSYVTGRAYLDGLLVLEAQDEYLVESQFWEIATVDWASRTANLVGTVTDGFPASP